MDDASAGADPSADPSAAPEQEGGFSVTITDNGDGTYSVAQTEDQDSDDSGAGATGDGDDSGPQTAQSLKEAFTMAEAMFKEEAGEEAGETGDGNAPIPADQTKAVWNQMASQRDKARTA